MKKLLLLSFLLPLLAFTAGDWLKVQLDENASINFPAKPDEIDLGGTPAWKLKLNEDASCMVLLVDFVKLGMDTAQLTAEFDTPEGFEDFRNSMLAEIEGAKLISEKKMKWKGFHLYDFKVDMGNKSAGAHNIMYVRAIMTGPKMYGIYFYEKEGKPQEALRNQFMASFTTN